MKKLALIAVAAIFAIGLAGCGDDNAKIQVPEDVDTNGAQIETTSPADDGRMVERGADCVAACNNYSDRCMIHVPGATAALKKDAYDSCMSECSGWDLVKINCIANAMNCESMTDVCGL